VTPEIVAAIARIVQYNWADEEQDYNTEALLNDNGRDNHIFGDLMLVQRWLESRGYPHVEPVIEEENENDTEEGT
jgi:hypothetical protein